MKTSPATETSLKDLSAAIRSANNVALTSHVYPDPDALGSACALHLILSKLGMSSTVLLSEKPIDRMTALTESCRIAVKDEIDDFSDFDLHISLDTASKVRGDCLFEAAIETLNIDHHVSNTLWGSTNYVDPTAASSTIIVMELAEELGVSLNAPISNLLLAGLVDDTGSFRFSNTDSRALRAAANLVEAGACCEFISNQLYFSVPERKLRLQARALERLELYENGSIGFISVTEEILKSLGANADDTDGLVDIPRSIKGVQVAVFFRENEGKWKLSLRSQSSQISVNTIAGDFGGGGHPAAAGCTIPGTFESVKKQVHDAIVQYLSELSNA